MSIESNNPFDAKKFGQAYKNLNVNEWDKNSSKIMKMGLKASFEQNPNALKALLATGNAELTHTQDSGRWKTDFPQALMEVRSELTQEQPIVEENKNKLNPNYDPNEDPSCPF